MRLLPDNEIHLWFTVPDDNGNPSEPVSAAWLLDEVEEARMKRLHSPSGRRLFGVSHTLVRRALSRYSETLPREWRFVPDAHGKPRIDPNLDPPQLAFSLAHTKGMAAVAVTRGADVGVDVERKDRRIDASRLSSRFFSPEEAAALRRLSCERLREFFFFYWTLKESYVKARGLGLSLPLDSFSFSLMEDAPFCIGFSNNSPDNPGEWRFALLRLPPQHVASVGVCFTRPDPVRIRCFHTLPSGEVLPLVFETLGLSPGVEMDG